MSDLSLRKAAAAATAFSLIFATPGFAAGTAAIRPTGGATSAVAPAYAPTAALGTTQASLDSASLSVAVSPSFSSTAGIAAERPIAAEQAPALVPGAVMEKDNADGAPSYTPTPDPAPSNSPAISSPEKAPGAEAHATATAATAFKSVAANPQVVRFAQKGDAAAGDELYHGARAGGTAALAAVAAVAVVGSAPAPALARPPAQAQVVGQAVIAQAPAAPQGRPSVDNSVGIWIVGAAVAGLLLASVSVAIDTFRRVGQTLGKVPSADEVRRYEDAKAVISRVSRARYVPPGADFGPAMKEATRFEETYVAYRHPWIAAIVRAFRRS
ncbi:MAG TPA: hypothetical protein VNI01_15505 [Elusimicrobiota bacterium]|nr:hypothetical protein [Elusimicrobiota bacterium]